MTARHIVTRIEKLESRHHRDDEVLLLWRKAGVGLEAAVAAAGNAGLFASGDLVVCAEWHGQGPPPEPRWSQNFPSDLTAVELDDWHEAMRRLAEGARAQPPSEHDRYSLLEIPTTQLWHMAFGVET